MKVHFTITFDCTYNIDPDEEEWQIEDDEGKYYFDEDAALDRLHDLVRDDPTDYAQEWADTVNISEIIRAKK